MLSVISNDAQRLELGPETARRVYFLKVPALMERSLWRKKIAASGGRLHGQIGLLDCLRDGVATLMKDSPEALAGALLAKIERHKENLLALHEAAVSGAADTDEGRAAFAEALERLGDSGRDLAVLETEVLASYPRYAAFVADDQTYWGVAGIEGARLFLVGWEGIDAPLRRIGNMTSDASLAEIPENDLDAIGKKLDELSRLSERARKNSSSPSATPSGGETSRPTNPATSGTAPNSTSENSASTPPS